MNKPTQQQIIIKLVALICIALLTSCGTTKAPEEQNVTEQASRVEISGNKPMASCNRIKNSNFDINIATVFDNLNQVSNQYVRVKFNFLSPEVTQSLNYVRFFKWRVIGSQSQLDPVPLEFSTYNLSSKQNTSNPMSAQYANQIDRNSGYYINLRDDAQTTYQVLKVVVYKSDSTILAQSNILIPQFLASPNDYKTNADGSKRADILQSLHPLFGQDTTGWSSAQLQQAVDMNCF